MPGNKEEANQKRKEVDFPLTEYRLVPVEEYERDEKRANEIDLIELAKYLFSRHKLIVKITSIFVVLGLIFAFLSPIEYQSKALLIPEFQSNQSQTGSLLKKYGGLLGLSGSDMGNDLNGVIPPTLYPKIIQSLPYQLELLNQNITFSNYDTTTTVYDFFENVYKPSILSYILEYTVGLPSKIKNYFSRRKNIKYQISNKIESKSFVSVSRKQLNVIKNMQNRISISLDDQTGILNLSVKMPDPLATAEIGQKCIVLLKNFVTNYRTSKARKDLDFDTKEMLKAKKSFEVSQNKLAEFRDSNTNLATAKSKTREQLLQSEYNLTFNVYNSLAQQVEQAKLKVQSQTPVVSVLQPMLIPLDKSSPKRLYILIGSMFFGLFVSFIFITFSYLKTPK